MCEDELTIVTMVVTVSGIKSDPPKEVPFKCHPDAGTVEEYGVSPVRGSVVEGTKFHTVTHLIPT